MPKKSSHPLCPSSQRDGDIVGPRCRLAPHFRMVYAAYYVAVKHRNHLGVMTASPISFQNLSSHRLHPDQYSYLRFCITPNYNYTGLAQNKSLSFPLYLFICLKDFDANGVIKFSNLWRCKHPHHRCNFTYPTNTLFVSTTMPPSYLPCDYNMDGKAKLDNPNDDQSLLSQIFLYPSMLALFIILVALSRCLDRIGLGTGG